MLAGSFCASDFPAVTDQRILASVFRYLHSLNLLAKTGEDEYDLAIEGRMALKRNGAFLLLFSYRGYFENLAGMLSGHSEAAVDRRHNVLGSGALHSKKFFPAVWEMFKESTPAALIDVGCGDGQFLASACVEWSGIAVAAVDLSRIAVDTTLERLGTSGRSNVIGVVQDAASVGAWIAALPGELKARTPLVVSMWFVAHEFSGGEPQTVINFFRELRAILPDAEIILGEITALPPELLAKNCDISIMPEFLLFHELSAQGVLSWNEWHRVLAGIPYELARERLFDVLVESGEKIMPSSFIWHLKPR
jgi:SAM-dependent methyltransferase